MFALKRIKINAIKKPVHFFCSQKNYQSSSLNPSYLKSKSKTPNFFKAVQIDSGSSNLMAMTGLLNNGIQLKKTLDKINNGVVGDYLHHNFIFWLNAYAKKQNSFCADYLEGHISLNLLCKDFIRFSFENKIYLDPIKTLDSFKRHNELSDGAIKMELEKLTPRREINLLGFGLDEGHYEQHLASYLFSSGKAEKVNLFGFDPYAKRNPNILYLTENELTSEKRSFDLIVARWVLHHVEMNSRWSNFVNCINQCHSGADVLVVEHGYIEETSLLNKKFNGLLNATFDIISNIGLRPGYFTNTKNIGDDFFINYLEPKDFSAITSQVAVKLDIDAYDVGPNFPNQTIFKMRVR